SDVTTLIEQIQENNMVYIHNDNIIVYASKGETIELYNAVGRKLMDYPAEEGKNIITIDQKGIILVKKGNKVSKVLL
ncbi:MAG: hypothetical protein LUG18_07495, partial [Candidatus Azobacteroides sp.]|nr:hypothetical protein [Candidatus Azobacteroides sp.]